MACGIVIDWGELKRGKGGAERKKSGARSMHWEFVRILAYGCRITKCVIDGARMSRSKTGEKRKETGSG